MERRPDTSLVCSDLHRIFFFEIKSDVRPDTSLVCSDLSVLNSVLARKEGNMKLYVRQ
jgi:hypothetical protein